MTCVFPLEELGLVAGPRYPNLQIHLLLVLPLVALVHQHRHSMQARLWALVVVAPLEHLDDKY